MQSRLSQGICLCERLGQRLRVEEAAADRRWFEVCSGVEEVELNVLSERYTRRAEQSRSRPE